MSSSHLIEHDERALVQLRHDLRQYVAAGVLLTIQPGDEQLDPEIRSRLRRINQLFSRMRELTDTPPAYWSYLRRYPPERTPPVDLVELVDECVSVTRLRRDVPLDLSGDGRVEAAVDPVMIRRAVSNVLDNATRAAGEGGQVHVGVHRLPGQAVVEVTDDGIGFGRIPSVSGHGMSIVDQALRSCHGRLEISSGPGPGTTVRMLIPSQPDPSELS